MLGRVESVPGALRICQCPPTTGKRCFPSAAVGATCVAINPGSASENATALIYCREKWSLWPGRAEGQSPSAFLITPQEWGLRGLRIRNEAVCTGREQGLI